MFGEKVDFRGKNASGFMSKWSEFFVETEAKLCNVITQPTTYSFYLLIKMTQKNFECTTCETNERSRTTTGRIFPLLNLLGEFPIGGSFLTDLTLAAPPVTRISVGRLFSVCEHINIWTCITTKRNEHSTPHKKTIAKTHYSTQHNIFVRFIYSVLT